MTVLINEITITAPLEEIWQSLSNVDELDKYDPTVKLSEATTLVKSGVNAARKVNMLDGKNWFEEKVIEWKPRELLTYQLTACSFPVNQLQHSYSFETIGKQTKVKQVMEYDIKYRFFGKVLDQLMIRRETDNGIKKFMAGLKSYVEE